MKNLILLLLLWCCGSLAVAGGDPIPAATDPEDCYAVPPPLSAPAGVQTTTTYFRRIYGQANLDDYLGRVVPIPGGGFYVIGRVGGEALNGELFAALHRLDAAGNVVWTQSLGAPSAYTDLVITATGNILLVGFTNPAQEFSRNSLIAVVDPGGTLLSAAAYNFAGREQLNRIVVGQPSADGGAPYYALGFITDDPPANDQVHLLNLDENGQIQWRRLLGDPDEDDQFYRDLVPLANGDLLLAGGRGVSIGRLAVVDNTGNPVAGIANNAGTFRGVLPRPGGGFYYATSNFDGTNNSLGILDADLNPVARVALPGVSSVALQAVADNSIYVSAQIDVAGTPEPHVMRWREEATGGLNLDWARFFNLGESEARTISVYNCSPEGMAYVSNRQELPDGFGAWDAVFGTTDFDFTACPATLTEVEFSAAPVDFGGTNPPSVVAELLEPTPVAPGDFGVESILLCESTPEGCEAECRVDVIDLSTGIDQLAGVPYNPGDGDAYWTLVEVPPSAGGITVPRPAFVIPTYPAWLDLPNAGYISGQPVNNWQVNGGPYVIERCFCVCAPGEYTFDLDLRVDDTADLQLVDDSGTLIQTLGSSSPSYSFNQPVADNVTATVFLQPGSYCIQADFYNTGNTAMGIAIEGSVSGPGLSSNRCCAPGAVITGRKFRDINCNGKPDPGEPGLSGWEITLTSAGGAPLTAITDSEGYYSFFDVVPGTYDLAETLQPGWVPSQPAGGIYTGVVVSGAEVLVRDFGNCQDPPCSQALNVSAEQVESDCCFNLSYANSGSDEVYGVAVHALDGVTLNATPAAGFQIPSFGPGSATVIPSGGGTFPAIAGGFLDLCLENTVVLPQRVVVDYLDAQYQVFCRDTLTFECPITDPCLDIVEASDSLTCTTDGYVLNLTIGNAPGGNFDSIGYVKIVITEPPLLAGTVIGQTYAPKLGPGETDVLDIPINSPIDLYGADLCFFVTAHDSEAERLCCFVDSLCIPFPLCDPCPFVETEIREIPTGDTTQCCFEVIVTNDFLADPGFFSQIDVNLVGGADEFSTVNLLPQPAGWDFPTVNTPGVSYSWTHPSGAIPLVSGQALFDFCIDETYSTDSVYVAVDFVGQDTICTDTIGVSCPGCLEITQDTLFCDPSAGYLYLFSFTNYSDYAVNTVAIIDAAGSPGTVQNPQVHTLGTFVQPGDSWTGTIPVAFDPSAGPGEVCFDIILRQVVEAEDIDIFCCYATHCVELPACESLQPPPCRGEAFIVQQACTDDFGPVCGCDGQTYANVCAALAVGVIDWEEGPCGTTPADPNLPLAAAVESGGVRLNWEWLAAGTPADYFVLAGLWPGEETEKYFAQVPAAGAESKYSFLHPNFMPGVNQYRVHAVTTEGVVVASNTVEVMVGDPENNLISVFPNPATQVVQVLSAHEGDAEVAILGLSGKVTHRQQSTFAGEAVAVPVGKQVPGVYTIRVQFADGTVAYRRFVKQ
jgi:hypothetical protein